MTDLRKHAEVMRTVEADCKTDAAALDRTPFTPRGMGETFGAQLAMIAAVAKSAAVLADELADREAK
jgi:hypothetical protein